MKVRSSSSHFNNDDAIGNLREGWNETGGAGWVAKTHPDDEIITLFAESFRGTPGRIGEPTVNWLLKASFPPDKLDEDFWKVFMGFAVHDTLGRSSKNGVFVGKKKEEGSGGGDGDGDEDNESHQHNFLEGGVVLRESQDATKERKSTAWWAKMWKSWGYTFLYLKLRSRFGPIDVFENDSYKTHVEHFSTLGDYLEEKLQEYREAYGPKEPHWYIKLVAIHPSAQGKGLGKDIMRSLHKAADANRRACYLETAGERNIHFYKSLGYEEVGKIKIVPTDDSLDPSHNNTPFEGIAMVRQPTS